MYDKKQLVIFISAGLVLVLLGFAVGMFLRGAVGSQAVKVKTMNSLSSKVITSIRAYGQVKSIEGRNITLTNLGEELVIPVADDVLVLSFIIKGKNIAPVQQKDNFESIKAGEDVNISIELSEKNKLEASAVTILPRAEE